MDDLLNYDIGVADVFQDVNTNMDIPSRVRAASQEVTKHSNGALGIDEEIKVVQKRKPIPKLDEDRLSGLGA